MTFDRFNFEQQILETWNITSDLDVLLEGVMECDLSRDQISNALLGLKEMYNLRFNKLFENFEAGVRERKIS